MKDWIPIAGSAKARLALVALEQFGARGYAEVGVSELAAKAGVTTGSLYHHFGGKRDLFAFARQEADRRVLDRMEGAAAALAGERDALVVRAILLVAFDAAVEHGLIGLLVESRAAGDDPVEEMLGRLLPAAAGPVAPRVIGAAWRAALAAVGTGIPAEQARAAVAALRVEP